MEVFRDPVTHSLVDQEANRMTWRDRVAERVKKLPKNDLAGICWKVYGFLAQESQGHGGHPPLVPLCEHAPDSYLVDHVLLVSAIAYCLDYDGESQRDPYLLRLAALSHEFPSEEEADIRAMLLDRVPAQDHDFLQRAWLHLDAQAQALVSALAADDGLQTYLDSAPQPDPDLENLSKAHLAASGRLHNHTFTDSDGNPVKTLRLRADFQRHPLLDAGTIALVYGGATKIKGYVFESARLPEVRGASALFDRINLRDLRVLWGEQNEMAAHMPPALLECPECIIFASGGNLLALAPMALAQELATAIEHRYTSETLVGNSVAVSADFSLLELQYGRQPTAYWVDDYQHDLEDEAKREVLQACYGRPKSAGVSDPTSEFYMTKTFGELVTVVASAAARRRAGWGDDEGDHRRRYIPHYELLPYAIKCHSCDTRPAVVRVQDPTDVPAGRSPKVFCEPCARKRVTGQVAKQETSAAKVRWFREAFDWRPHEVALWESRFREFLKDDLERSLSYYRRLPAQVQAKLKDLSDLTDAEKQTLEAALSKEEGILRTEAIVNALSEIQSQRAQAPGKHSDIFLPANDLNEIGAASRPDRYVGLIYADGNNVGALLSTIRSPAAYRQFAQRLFEASQAAVFSALADELQPLYLSQALDPERPRRREMWVHPFEIVTIGGDDMILIVPGDRALAITTRIGLELERLLGRQLMESEEQPDMYETPQRYRRYLKPVNGGELFLADDRLSYERKISLSAGVVVGLENTPIFFLWELAQQLIKSAKQARNRKPWVSDGYKGGLVDFQILKAIGMVGSRLGDFRERAYLRRDEEGKRWLTARPYSLPELIGLLRTAQALKRANFPRYQLHQVQHSLHLGRLPSQINYLYFYSRLRESEQREELFRNFHLAWHTETEQLPPWRVWMNSQDVSEKKHFETIWADLVEIYDFATGLQEETDAPVSR